MNLYREEIALATELRTWGAHWKSIARGLGVTANHLTKAVSRAEHVGFSGIKTRPPVGQRNLAPLPQQSGNGNRIEVSTGEPGADSQDVVEHSAGEAKA